MRFDDSLKTVLSAEMSTGFGAASAWRQLVDLMGRGRIVSDDAALAKLRDLRASVPAEIRAASARALAYARPPASLVALFAQDDLPIAAPVLRIAQLPAADWLSILPALSPSGRSVLRHRRDLPAEVSRGLESFGSVDFVLPDGTPAPRPEPEVTQPATMTEDAAEPTQVVPSVPLSPDALTSPGTTPFVALGEITRGLPLVAEARRQADVPPPASERFEISDLVKRIDAFNRRKEAAPPPAAMPTGTVLHYETDAEGVIRWIEGVSRAALIGVSLAHAGQQGLAQVDGVAAGAFRRRSRFTDARLMLGGGSDAAGDWRVSGVPIFDHASGRFSGYRGTGRRPRADETTRPSDAVSRSASESLRQLVHELRTPTNAIAGFAELIETELLGPIPPTYRERATAIRTQAGDLLAAIEDLDTAARIEGHALELRAEAVPVARLLEQRLADLRPLVALRGAEVDVVPVDPALAIAGDERALDRLVGRLLATLISATRRDEYLAVSALAIDGQVRLTFDRPQALSQTDDDGSLLSLETEADVGEIGAPLLGTGFALRLARNLAGELGGSLSIETDRLTLRLPLVVDHALEQATTH